MFEKIRRVGMSAEAATALLVLDTMAWGLSYVVIKIGARDIPPFELIALRFTIASLVCLALFRRSFAAGVSRRAVVYGTVLGIAMFLGSTTMVYGVQTTDASTAGFLASAKILFVPILVAIWLRQLPERRIFVGILSATVGIALLSLKDGLQLSMGAVLCIASALFYALHIAMTGGMAKKESAILIGVIQQIAMAVLGWICLALFNTPMLPTTGVQWTVILVLALVNGVFVFVSQPIAQQFASAERTALIFAMEPVFSAIFSFLLMGDRFTLRDICGAALILASVLLASNARKGPLS
ncbi:MAG: DMT family transporter [Peptococcaceae bacterium]|nr:DMT family transporter [Peptococcaceae bacterium]